MILRRNKILNDSFRQIIGISENQMAYFIRQLSLLGTEHGSRKFEGLLNNY